MGQNAPFFYKGGFMKKIISAIGASAATAAGLIGFKKLMEKKHFCPLCEIKKVSANFKFNDKIYIYKAFVNFIIKNKKICRFLKNYDIIIPVPIHYRRKIKRGYNQSALIAKEISKNYNSIKYINDVLLKQKNNKPQSTKNKKEREKNVIGAYYIKNEYKIYNKKILLLDDIYTTGSTVNECAKALKQARS